MTVVGIKELEKQLGKTAELVDIDIITVDHRQFIRIKGKQFLEKEDFSKIYTVVEKLKGEYISAGKTSHFRVPLEGTPQIPQLETPTLAEIVDEFERLLTKLRKAVYP